MLPEPGSKLLVPPNRFVVCVVPLFGAFEFLFGVEKLEEPELPEFPRLNIFALPEPALKIELGGPVLAPPPNANCEGADVVGALLKRLGVDVVEEPPK